MTRISLISSKLLSSDPAVCGSFRYHFSLLSTCVEVNEIGAKHRGEYVNCIIFLIYIYFLFWQWYLLPLVIFSLRLLQENRYWFVILFQVDLLGDEVDALLRLLEKMYIALDHYSPILQHYPGVSSFSFKFLNASVWILMDTLCQKIDKKYG